MLTENKPAEPGDDLSTPDGVRGYISDLFETFFGFSIKLIGLIAKPAFPNSLQGRHLKIGYVDVTWVV